MRTQYSFRRVSRRAIISARSAAEGTVTPRALAPMLALWGLCAALSFAGCQPEPGPAGSTNSAAPAADDSRIAPTLDTAQLRHPLTIEPLAWVQQTKLYSGDGSTGTSFGRAVAIAGDTAVIGAWYASPSGLAQAGTAYVFVRSGTVWTKQAQLNASDLASDAGFGYAVAIANDTIVIGSSGASSYAGKAYVFTRSGTTWSEQAEALGARLACRDGNMPHVAAAFAAAPGPARLLTIISYSVSAFRA